MKIGIFGTGSALKDFLSVLPSNHEVAALADNNPARHGQEVEGHSIGSANELVAVKPDLVVIACACG